MEQFWSEMSQQQLQLQTQQQPQQQPGQFTGSTGVKVLTPAELAAGAQAWVTKVSNNIN